MCSINSLYVLIHPPAFDFSVRPFMLATPVGLIGSETKEDPAGSPDPSTSTERKSVTFSLQLSGEACARHLPGRGLHSSTFRLNVSTFCGIRWVHDFPPVY